MIVTINDKNYDIKLLTYKQVKNWAKNVGDNSDLELVQLCIDNISTEQIEDLPYFAANQLVQKCLEVNQLGEYAKKN